MTGKGGFPVYGLTLELDPEKSRINVTGSLLIPSGCIMGKELKIYLHKDLKFRSLKLNGQLIAEPGTVPSDIRYMPDALVYSLPVTGWNDNEGSSELSFEYGGKISGQPEWLANVISESWTEIGLYFPWFPLNPELKLFHYRLNVKVKPEFRVFAMGREERKADRLFFETIDPTSDIVVCVSRGMKIDEKNIRNNEFRLVHHSLEPETVTALLSDVDSIYRYFDGLFGKKEGSMALVESMRKKGGGYSRPGGLFLPGFAETPYIENRPGYRRYLAHEIAHNWWRLADPNNWHDWLNESFAEYSALMFLRDIYGEKEYRKRMEKYSAEAEGIPVIWEIDRNHEKAFQALYRKGPVLLMKLEERLNREKFSEFCRLILDEKVALTDTFLSVLEKTEGRETALWFGKLLKEF